MTRATGGPAPDRRAARQGTTALVLSGGGVTGIAWEIGVLHGLRAAGGALAERRTTGAEVVPIGPDEEYLAGPGAAALDPAGRAAAADLGERFGRAVAAAHP